jgi:hypothetical protein
MRAAVPGETVRQQGIAPPKLSTDFGAERSLRPNCRVAPGDTHDDPAIPRSASAKKKLLGVTPGRSFPGIVRWPQIGDDNVWNVVTGKTFVAVPPNNPIPDMHLKRGGHEIEVRGAVFQARSDPLFVDIGGIDLSTDLVPYHLDLGH